MIPTATRKALLSELQAYEHLMFEPMTQADLNGLYAVCLLYTSPSPRD